MGKNIIITEEQFKYLNQFAKVFHMKDSSKYTPIKYDDWTDFWKSKMPGKQFPQSGSKCPCCEKKQEEFVGGHVIFSEDTDKKVDKRLASFYICPVCKSCNSKAAHDEKFRKTKFMVLKEMLVPVYEGEYEVVEENHSK